MADEKRVIKQTAKGDGIIQAGRDVIINVAEDVQSVFDDAARLINEGNPQTAQILLETKWKSHNDKMTPRQKSNCTRLLGCSLDRQDKMEEAGKCFLQAKDFDPTWEKARAFEAFGYLCLGNPGKAHALAESVLQEYSQNNVAWSVWIQTAPGEVSFPRIEARVPNHLQKDAGVAMALAVRAASEGDYEMAAKFMARAQDQAPDNPRVTEKLGDLMLQRAGVNDQILRQSSPSDASQSFLQRAEEFYTAAIQKWQKEHSEQGIIRVRLRRAWVRTALLRHEEATADTKVAYEMAPNDPEVAYSFAAFIGGDNLDVAIGALKKVAGKGESPQIEHLLGQMLRQRDSEGDREAAVRILRCRLTDVNVLPEGFRPEYVGLVMQLEREQHGIDRAIQILESIPAEVIGDTPRAVLRAEILWLDGKKQDAVTAAMDLYKGVDSSTPIADRRRLAKLMQTMGLHRNALHLWKTIVSAEYIGMDTYSLIECAHRCEDAVCIIDFSSTLRKNGIWDRRIFELELGYRESYNDDDGAERVMREFLERPADQTYVPSLRARLSMLGIRTHRPDLIETDGSKLPRAEETGVVMGNMVVRVLRYGPEPMKAVEYAYELLRCNRADNVAHATMIGSLLPTGPKVNVDTPETACAGAAILYAESDTGVQRWHVIEDSATGQARSEWNEFSPEHPLSLAMMGCKVGDCFLLTQDGLQDRSAKIEKIVSKYVYRFNDCLEEFERRFPGESAIRRFIVTETSGKPDISFLDRMVRRDAEVGQRLIDLYESMPCPVFVLADSKSRSMLETMKHVAATPGLRLRCCRGTDEEEELAEAALGAADTVVLDTSAVVTLLFTRTCELILKFPFNFVTSRGVVNELRNSEVLHGDPDNSAGVYSVDGFIPVSKEELERERDYIEATLAFIEESFNVESGLIVAEVESEHRKRLLQLFGHAGLEAMLLGAQTGRVLWTDDFATAELARSEFGCRRVWTQLVFSFAAGMRAVDQDTSESVAARLLAMEYYYTKPTTATVVHAVEQTDGDVDKAPLFQVLNWFGDQNVKLGGLYFVGAGVLKAVWQKYGMETTPQRVTIRILERLSQRPRGFQVIEGLHENIDRIFGLDVITAHKVKELIAAWLKGRSTKIILP